MTVNVPEPLAFLLEHPLYEAITFGTEDSAEAYRDLMRYEIEHYDWHCNDCGNVSVFHIDSQKSRHYYFGPMSMISILSRCTRSNDHVHAFHILVIEGDGILQFVKIGQYPSLADLAQAENNKYRIVLEKNKFKELSRGIGLAAHGIGIGAFVYLRRVFENLIENAHLESKSDPQWDEEKYQKSRMDEKIKQLKEYLPEFLVNHSSIYGILSKGVHELEEEECLAIFPAIKTAIELILDEKIRAKEQAEKEKNAARAISNVGV